MSTTIDKRKELLALARRRKASQWPGYTGIGDYHKGAYECDFVSPYTKSAGNVNAEIFVLLQDWSSDEGLRGPIDNDCVQYGLTRNLPTNRNLTDLLRSHFGVSLGDVYATNLFPFIKTGKMSASIAKADLIRAACEFALPQIRIVQPRLVICLGLETFNSIREACGMQRVIPMTEAIESPFRLEKTWIWCQAHTGARGLNNRRRMRVEADWQRMKQMAAGSSTLKSSVGEQNNVVRIVAPLRIATSVNTDPGHMESEVWKGKVEGPVKNTYWTGEVELVVEGVRVTGFIKWKSDRGHCGTEKVEGSVNGESLSLNSLGTSRDNDKGCKQGLAPSDYRGTLTKRGWICFDWYPKSDSAQKGAADGWLSKVQL